MNKLITDVSPELTTEFKSAMRRLAATVTIVSVRHGEQRHGMAATAVTSLTTDPPSLLACVNNSASIHDPIVESGGFCVNLLACEHHHLVPTFSGKEKGEQRFASGEWGVGDMDIPYLVGAQASIFCKVDESLSYHSHTIFIGAVRSIRMTEDVAPLVYQDGGFFKTIAMAN